LQAARFGWLFIVEKIFELHAHPAVIYYFCLPLGAVIFALSRFSSAG
jgi:hypothetical protein